MIRKGLQENIFPSELVLYICYKNCFNLNPVEVETITLPGPLGVGGVAGIYVGKIACSTGNWNKASFQV